MLCCSLFSQWSDGFNALRIVFYLWHLSTGTDVYTGSRHTHAQHMLICLCIYWFRVRLLWVLVQIAMEYSRHVGSKHPIRVHLAFSQTQLVEIVTWQVQYVKRQEFNLQFTQCKQEAADSLPALKPWHYLSIRLSHLQTLKSIETVMLFKLVMWPLQPIMFGWWHNSSRSIYFAS